ncbi:MAG: YlbF family regulator [Bacilli bacterium]|nr:YlbF family regulator [Bacilli bacterium]
MNKTIETLAREINEELLNTEEIKNYLKYKQLVETDDNLKNLKKLIVRYKNENRLEDYEKALKEYNENPIVINYNLYNEEAYSLLLEIKDIIK